jgi:hypothetical protein
MDDITEKKIQKLKDKWNKVGWVLRHLADLSFHQRDISSNGQVTLYILNALHAYKNDSMITFIC